MFGAELSSDYLVRVQLTGKRGVNGLARLQILIH